LKLERIMKREIITAKVPKQKRRADFLFHDGQFKPKSERNRKAYDRKLAKKDFDTKWFDC